jgi:hypothetical protein
MVKFRDLNTASQKLQQNGQNAAAIYVKNATAAAGTWAANTAASEPNYVAGVQAAAQRGAFGKGVAKAGAGRYSGQITSVGQTRFSDGMSKAGPRWQANFSPLATAVSNVDIGPRGLRGSVANKSRASAMSDAWHAAKMAATA